MGYTSKRFVIFLSILIAVALLVAGIWYVISRTFSLGNAINDKTHEKLESSEPTEGAVLTERRASVPIWSLDGSAV